jgi:hypothetical protein
MQIDYSLFRFSLLWASAWEPLNKKSILKNNQSSRVWAPRWATLFILPFPVAQTTSIFNRSCKRNPQNVVLQHYIYLSASALKFHKVCCFCITFIHIKFHKVQCFGIINHIIQNIKPITGELHNPSIWGISISWPKGHSG